VRWPGGRLAAAVSNGGGLGLVGGGRGDEDWVRREVAIVAASTEKPWGIGFLTWSLTRSVIEGALAFGPAAVLLSFGDPKTFAHLVHEAGAKLIVQVTDLDGARRAADVGAELIVAQGGEAGGHGGTRATLPFVPTVVDLVRPIPVLAAGGIADGRGLAAALVLGAAGALIGTRFEATNEAVISAEAIDLILARGGGDTERNRVLDIARDSPWPARYPARTLRNAFLDTWRGREEELQADVVVRAAYQRAVLNGDMSVAPVWAGEALDLVTEVASAVDLVGHIAAHAERILAEAHGHLTDDETDR